MRKAEAGDDNKSARRKRFLSINLLSKRKQLVRRLVSSS
jgi:hypothetical protein